MKVMMITGAGISVGSGIDTYRGADGRYTAIEKELGMPIHTLLTLKTLQDKPELVWKYWLQFALGLKDKEPSKAHMAIKAIADQADEFLEVTQNVDGLSVKAGLSEDHLIELHGVARRYHCMNCGRLHMPSIEAEMAIPPMCYLCDPEDGSVIRPSIVLFNENINDDHYSRAADFALKADLLIISGTSMQFPYLIYFVTLSIQRGAMVVYIDPEAEVNPDWFVDGWGQRFTHTASMRPISDSIFCIRQSADEVLPLIANDFERCLQDLAALHQRGNSTIKV